MPLTELMHYFNDRLQSQARSQSLPATGLFKSTYYHARFGGLTFGTRLHPIVHTRDASLLGHEAELVVRSATNRLFTLDEVFQSLDDDNLIVHLDRLIRTLHSLNYLEQIDGEGLLSLSVHPRHIASVPESHGRAFDGILKDCGLGPERIILHTSLVDKGSLEHFHKALISYRSFGYQTGLTLRNQADTELLRTQRMPIDYLYWDREPEQWPDSLNPDDYGKVLVRQTGQEPADNRFYAQTLSQPSSGDLQPAALKYRA